LRFLSLLAFPTRRSSDLLVELSLSVDNLFVFLLIFAYFKVPAQYQHKALFWGILGALVMRAMFIAAGVTLMQEFLWIIYVFGARSEEHTSELQSRSDLVC